MHEKIDDALDRIIGLTIKEYEDFEPATVAEKLAKSLIDEASGEGAVRAIQIIAERSGGKVGIKNKDEAGQGALAELMLKVKASHKI